MAGGDGWRDTIRDSVAARAAESLPNIANVRTARAGFSPEAHSYLVRAAALRGITVAGYVRRATMAHVAMDLGIDPVEIFAVDLGIKPQGGIGRQTTRDLSGELYGRWGVRHDGPRDDDHS